jgi:prevent-host-death family protein
MERVGVRELRQNLSVYLRRVKAGESLDVTERGEVVARLVPLDGGSRLERWIREGKARPAAGDVRDLPPPRPLPAGARPMSETLEEMRDAERP